MLERTVWSDESIGLWYRTEANPKAERDKERDSFF